MFNGINTHYIQPIRSFNRNTRRFLWMTVILGIILSGWQLFFNIYILQRGFGRDFLGMVNSLPSLAGLLLGIPIGRLSDRIGRKPAFMIGITFSSLAYLGQVTFTQPALIAVMSALTGVFNMFLIVSQSPMMMKLSTAENRTMLFSLHFGLETFAGAVGSFFAGQLPAVFGRMLHVGGTSAIAYQAVLIVTVLLGTTALIPLWLMKEPQTNPAAPDQHQNKIPSDLKRLTLRLAAPNFLTGFGAAILIPYMNVFFKDRFQISDSLMGIIFGLSSLFIGIGSILGPRLTTVMGSKIRAIVLTQFSSIVFLLLVGFSGSLWVAGISILLRSALMNMSAPLYNAFCMEQTPEHRQGFISSILNIAWQIGWSVGPFISGLVQQAYGFAPLFIATTVLYLLAIALMWTFFSKTETQQ